MKLNPNVLTQDAVNFVCKKCQKVYYKSSLKDFESSPKKVARAAKEYRKHYHKCPWERKNR